MKKERTKHTTGSAADEDTMRPEYDFSKAIRGVTAKRYALGSNVVENRLTLKKGECMMTET